MNWRCAILDSKNNPTPYLLTLLDALRVQHNGTLASIVTATQQAWLRPAGKERWEVQEVSTDKRATIVNMLRELGFGKVIQPEQKSYDYAIVFGGLLQRAQQRIGYLAEQWHAGIRFGNVIILGAQRPLDPVQENIPVLQRTETGMLEFVIGQMHMPPELRAIITVIDTPMQLKSDGTERRPNTGDTVQQWLKQIPTPGYLSFRLIHLQGIMMR